ncbi:MAG: riboflavin kinase/FMN adenylyltransferase [Paraglaciecola psychrophila]|jgi:riboflavin kinase/FMN adenylyltransferase
MELIRGLVNLRPRHRECVTTIGAFDGVHLGHREVLQQLIDRGRALGLPTVVVLFEPLPREFFAPQQAPSRLMSFREKFLALKALGIDRVLRIRFTEAFSGLDPEDFIEQVFVQGLASRYVIVGDDFRFGHDRTGTFEVLKQAGRDHGFEVVPTATFEIGQERVSSTRIRQALESSNFELAASLLGQPYSMSGKVMLGRQLGRTLGAATANVEPNRIRVALSGVYAVAVLIGEKTYSGVANVGIRPTVNSLQKAILEVHILDFTRDIYGQRITVVFRHKIREEKKFDSLEALKTAIHQDFSAGRAYFDLPASV